MAVTNIDKPLNKQVENLEEDLQELIEFIESLKLSVDSSGYICQTM